ncbi:tRNA pseudouridine synthase B [secondary endosymbiont of Trabutina mannipara]|uniref:tRNA pseudouridine synthase B n=1 Tax=secondary endosymbiont of Trabutina mannipara TaxID=1835721 RepID=A0A1C3L449_9ENTR|nr:tRNA pseudouridine(55) synthase TruB [secondary endosymbiont of Trabutina mannipara]SBT82063.1 tRNA pseudouridine synthase B [secondary endosymbiont of Trabutina mannipara]
MNRLKGNCRYRNINGIVLLDKPINISSNDVLQTVKRIYYANKAGHTGSLDPLATGMLPICLGEATKFSQYLLNADKRYKVTAKLGERTNTSDANGQTISIRPVSLNKTKLIKELKYFCGESNQVPSMFSALKYHGRPLYEYARKGINVVREARKINVYDLKLHNWNLNKLELEIHCSKGTYIRTIIDDLGERLGCGAHVIALRRTAVANYSSSDMITLTALQAIYAETLNNKEKFSYLDALLLPIDSALIAMPTINIPSYLAYRLLLGQNIKVIAPHVGLVRIIYDNSNFLGIGEINSQALLIPRCLVKNRT